MFFEFFACLIVRILSEQFTCWQAQFAPDDTLLLTAGFLFDLFAMHTFSCVFCDVKVMIRLEDCGQ